MQQTLAPWTADAAHPRRAGVSAFGFGGTNCHMLNVDCSSVVGEDGTKLSGDQAARILDIVGVVVNRNTIPGDKSAAAPSGIRLGTPWITQRGFDEEKCRQLADVIADVLLAAAPHRIETPNVKRTKRRAKVVVYGAARDAPAADGEDGTAFWTFNLRVFCHLCATK